MFRKTVLYFQHVAIAIIISDLKKGWPIITFIYYLQNHNITAQALPTRSDVVLCVVAGMTSLSPAELILANLGEGSIKIQSQFFIEV